MYIENAPTYEAIQWDGTNASLIETKLLETTPPEYHVSTAVVNGALVLTLQYGMKFTVPENGWVVSAAGWGPGLRESRIGLCQVLTDAEFARRFTVEAP